MDTADLTAFLVVAQREHVTESAALLGISQPTLSRRLAALEREVGVPLFDRDGKRLRLNRYGRLFSRTCRQVVDQLGEATRQLAELDDPARGEIHLAYLSWLGSWLVPDLLKSFRAEMPHARFLLHAGSAAEIEQQLTQGTVDCILTTRRPADDRARWAILRQEELYLAVPPGHRLADRSKISLREAEDDDYIMPTIEVGLRGVIDRLCEQAGITPRVVLESHELSTIRGLVEAGLGVAVLHQDHRHAESQPVYLPLSDAGASRDVGIAWLHGVPAPPVVIRFWETAMRHCPGQPLAGAG